jgi:hypothetical protein
MTKWKRYKEALAACGERQRGRYTYKHTKRNKIFHLKKFI